MKLVEKDCLGLYCIINMVSQIKKIITINSTQKLDFISYIFYLKKDL